MSVVGHVTLKAPFYIDQAGQHRKIRLEELQKNQEEPISLA